MLVALRAYVNEHLDDWDRFAGALPYGYNTQIHSAMRLGPLEVTVSRPPVRLTIQNMASTSEPHPRLQGEQFLARLKSVMATASKNIRGAQARYKDLRLKTFDAKRLFFWSLRPINE